MGLDQYLSRKIYIGGNVTGTIDVYKNGERVNVDLNKVSYIEEDAGYWRKANAIHDWFVKNVQDGDDNCETYYVSTQKMEELLSIVNQVLADHSRAEELLPIASGFFFGGTEYDEWYFGKLEDTKKILEDALNTDGGEFYYSSSW